MIGCDVAFSDQWEAELLRPELFGGGRGTFGWCRCRVMQLYSRESHRVLALQHFTGLHIDIHGSAFTTNTTQPLRFFFNQTTTTLSSVGGGGGGPWIIQCRIGEQRSRVTALFVIQYITSLKDFNDRPAERDMYDGAHLLDHCLAATHSAWGW